MSIASWNRLFQKSSPLIHSVLQLNIYWQSKREKFARSMFLFQFYIQSFFFHTFSLALDVNWCPFVSQLLQYILLSQYGLDAFIVSYLSCICSNLHHLSVNALNWSCLTMKKLVMSSVQTNVSFLNGVSGANVLRRAQNEIEDCLLSLETEHCLHMEPIVQVIYTYRYVKVAWGLKYFLRVYIIPNWIFFSTYRRSLLPIIFHENLPTRILWRTLLASWNVEWMCGI